MRTTEHLKGIVKIAKTLGDTDAEHYLGGIRDQYAELVRLKIVEDYPIQNGALSPRERALARLGHNSPNITPAERAGMLSSLHLSKKT